MIMNVRIIINANNVILSEEIKNNIYQIMSTG